MPDYSLTKKVLACTLLFFPVLSILGFLLHFHSIPAFFHFRLERPPYNAAGLFDALVSGRGHGFVLAHVIVYLAMPFLLVTTLVLAWYLSRSSQWLALLGAATGIMGCLAMAGVLSSWLSFAAVGHVAPQYYDGARAALLELTKMQGILGFNSACAYLAFGGLIILAAGLLVSKLFPARNMICIILGSLLFFFFMDMDNWMLIGTIFLLIGFVPVAKRLWRQV